MEGENNRVFQQIKKIFFFLVCLFFLLGHLAVTEAASLFFSPAVGAYKQNDNFSVGVYVTSADEAMNAVSGEVSFPKDLLEVTSLSKGGSIISFWVKEPDYSNSDGVINFEGIVLNPGFTGSNGRILTINFKIKDQGTAAVYFSSGQVLANDGEGKNILTISGSANFTLGVPAQTDVQKTAEPSVKKEQVLAEKIVPVPQLFSRTHPDQGKWYQSGEVQMNWNIIDGITAVKLGLDTNPDGQTRVNYAPPIWAKKLPGVDEGVYYFHAQFRNANGWSQTATFKLQIDMTPPTSLAIEFPDGREIDKAEPALIFKAQDALSGIDHYELQINGGDWVTVPAADLKEGVYKLPAQTFGKKSLIVKAFDFAGNYTVAADEFIIKHLPTPELLVYPDTLTSGQSLVVKGTSHPGTTVIVWLQRVTEKSVSQEIPVGLNGQFTFIAKDKIRAGAYKLWAEAVDDDGNRSDPSRAVVIIGTMPFYQKLLGIFIDYLSFIVPIAALLLILYLFLHHTYHRVRRKTKTNFIHPSGTEDNLAYDIINLLSASIRGHIAVLENIKRTRGLLPDEEKILAGLKNDLEKAAKLYRQTRVGCKKRKRLSST